MVSNPSGLTARKVASLFSKEDVANIEKVADLMDISVDEYLIETVRASVDMMLDVE